MSWTTPRTWVAGETVTAAIMNTHVRDNLAYLAAPALFVGVQLSAQAIPNTGLTAITLDSEVIDTDGGHSTVTNTSRYAVPFAGYYDVDAVILYSANTTGQRRAAVYVNGSEVIEANFAAVTTGGATTSATVATIVGPLSIGDYIEIYGFQTGASSLNTFTSGSLGSRMNTKQVRLT